ncbi:unnamed protein product [Leptidea sinapis]|uniref:Uncharacterized protein n=1 Tax=Leptidea sinapis TaxID=189913 RepID=A0A5E4QIT6_9NEOP|nr:unnamed protein product [Leptidea sinapis]
MIDFPQLKLQFDDSLTRTFEYPSETSLCEDTPSAAPAPAASLATLADNTHLNGAGGGLGHYTPSKTLAEHFELGVAPAALDHERVGPPGHPAREAGMIQRSRLVREGRPTCRFVLILGGWGEGGRIDRSLHVVQIDFCACCKTVLNNVKQRVGPPGHPTREVGMMQRSRLSDYEDDFEDGNASDADYNAPVQEDVVSSEAETDEDDPPIAPPSSRSVRRQLQSK